MNLEKENAEKRKTAPLTNSEALTFFLLPFKFGSLRRYDQNEFNASEMDRFRQHGFDLKLKQARELRMYGFIFYAALGVIIAYLFMR